MYKTLLVCLLVVVALSMQSEARPGHRHGHHRRGHHGHRNHGGRGECPHRKPLCKEETSSGRILMTQACPFPEYMECKQMPDRPHQKREEHEQRRGRSERQEISNDINVIVAGAAQEEPIETIKSYCVPRSCDPEAENPCPEGSECIAPRRVWWQDNRPPRCQMPCDIKLFLHACRVTDMNGEVVKPETECPREGSSCGINQFETITIDDEIMHAFFCDHPHRDHDHDSDESSSQEDSNEDSSDSDESDESSEESEESSEEDSDEDTNEDSDEDSEEDSMSHVRYWLCGRESHHGGHGRHRHGRRGHHESRHEQKPKRVRSWFTWF